MKNRAWFLVFLGVFGCGGVDPVDTEETASSTEPLLPFAAGNSWTYQVTDADGNTSTKTTTIEEKSLIGGTGVHQEEKAFHVLTMKKDGTDKSESWQGKEGDRIVRYRELAYSAKTGALTQDEDWDPSKLHVDGGDEHTEEGASWLEIYTENKTDETGALSSAESRDLWSVVGVSEKVTVPAGTFEDAIVLEKTGGSSVKKYWYVRGVGKVKETGTQTEELIEFTLK